MISDLLKLARPHQYTKNLLVFIPAFFAHQLTEPGLVANAAIAFVAFSLLASAVYIFNDWVDRHEDALHPEKRLRPIASGRVKAPQAFIFLTLLLIVGGSAACIVSFEVFALVLIYLVLNIAYTIKLKHIAIIDILVISSGFVIRLLVGAEATLVNISNWIIVMTFLLALFLSLAKRRDDVLIYIKVDQKMRKVIDGYNLNFLDSLMTMTASITIVSYIVWSVLPEVTQRFKTENLYLTSIFVVIGIIRYIKITLVEEKSGNPSNILLNDRLIQMTLVGWLSVFGWILYFK